MKIPFFNRKPKSVRQEPPRLSTDIGNSAVDPHRMVLDQLRAVEAEQPHARAQLAGKLLFEGVCKLVADERGARMEDILAILASGGGFSCLAAAFNDLSNAKAPAGADLVTVQGADGHRYFFGDLPNRYLIENELSLLGLTLGMAQACGGEVSLEMALEVIRRVAGTVGAEEFGKPQLPAEHRLRDLPFNYVRDFWPWIAKGLNLYEVPPVQRPAAIGFALQRAIEAGKDVIDPTLAARIVIECAVPMAKIDPDRLVRAPAAPPVLGSEAK